MKLKKYAPLLLAAFLFGCGENIVIPEKYSQITAKFEVTKMEYEQKGRSGHRLTIYVDANVNDQASPTERAAAAFKIAMKTFEAQKMASVVYVSLHDPGLKLAGTPARLRLTPDGCTFSRDPVDCNGAIWTLNNSNKSPSQRQRNINKSWHEKRYAFQTNGVTDEDALIEFIAKDLKISQKDVGLFNYADYENEELFK